MFIKWINSIPRFGFYYKSKFTLGYRCYKEFIFPINPVIYLRSLLESLRLKEDLWKLDELGILKSHDLIYNPDYKILAVGVGSGISLIHNCSKNSKNANYVAIEASANQIELATNNALLNNVDLDKFTIHQGYVGIPTGVYKSDSITYKHLDINLFDFDVLELDCEGSEIEILESMTAMPKYIIVEMHPHKRKIDIEKFNIDLRLKGYNLVQIFTVSGKGVPEGGYKEYFNHSTIQTINSTRNGKVLDLILVMSYKFISQVT
jgi:hypothetical protein